MKRRASTTDSSQWTDFSPPPLHIFPIIHNRMINDEFVYKGTSVFGPRVSVVRRLSRSRNDGEEGRRGEGRRESGQKSNWFWSRVHAKASREEIKYKWNIYIYVKRECVCIGFFNSIYFEDELRGEIEQLLKNIGENFYVLSFLLSPNLTNME